MSWITAMVQNFQSPNGGFVLLKLKLMYRPELDGFECTEAVMTQPEYLNEILDDAGFVLLLVVDNITLAKRNEIAGVPKSQHFLKATSCRYVGSVVSMAQSRFGGDSFVAVTVPNDESTARPGGSQINPQPRKPQR
jgi:hypothetical protein